MPSEVSVRLATDQEYRFDLSGSEPMTHEVARLWLDEQFTTLDCEPLRASGKVLLADKVLTVAQAAGSTLLSQPEWGQRFALATSAALARPIVRVDVSAMTITY